MRANLGDESPVSLEDKRGGAFQLARVCDGVGAGVDQLFGHPGAHLFQAARGKLEGFRQGLAKTTHLVLMKRRLLQCASINAMVLDT